MKTYLSYFLVFLFFFSVRFAYTKLFGPIPFAVNSITTTKSDTFNVTGIGKASVIPDVGMVSLGVQANGATVKEVQQKINIISNAVVKGAEDVGVEAKDIKTTNYSINPSYDFSGGSQRITGFQANSSISVKVRDLTKINSVIDAATGAGANQVGGVSFDVDDRTVAESEARKLAVADAKKKAGQAAAIAGFRLGRMVNYQENFAGNVRPMPMMAAVKDVGLGGGTQVEPGSNEIDLTVTLSYEIQ
mgnify:CR=1 FL=1